MIPALQFTYWQWASLALAAPVVVWGAWPFHRAAWINLRHGAATMDTLISIGVSAAFLWSLYALFFGDAGMPGMTHALRVDDPAERRRRRHLPRGRRRASRCSCSPAATSRCAPSAARAPRCARCSSWARRMSRCDAPDRRRDRRDAHSGRRAARRRRVRRAPGREDRDRRRRRLGHLGGGRLDSSPASRCPSRSAPGDPVVGATVNAGGRLDRPRDARRRRHAARADGAARRRGAVGQGRRAAARRPHLGRLRPDRPRDRRSRRSPSGCCSDSRRPAAVDRGRRGPDHRVPLRARARDADRAAGRHRPRRAARHPDQGP